MNKIILFIAKFSLVLLLCINIPMWIGAAVYPVLCEMTSNLNDWINESV